VFTQKCLLWYKYGKNLIVPTTFYTCSWRTSELGISLGMSSFSKPFTENSLSRSLKHWIHWHRFHRHSVSVSARLNYTDTECRWNRCQCSQCSSGLIDDRKVTVLQYLHWNCSSLNKPHCLLKYKAPIAWFIASFCF
jgi:hypothetical protein